MKYISYYRVSTAKQGIDGNGIKAQRKAVKDFLSADDELIQVFTEVESGTNGDRPLLKDAVQLCKDTGAKLLVAKLDRLSRNVKFLFALKDELEDAGVSFCIVNLPEANNTMVLGVMATMAQHEREVIQTRTSEALDARREEHGEWRQGREFSEAERAKAKAVVQRNARKHPAWRRAFWFIKAKRENEGMSYQAIAKALNKEGYRTRRDKKFHPAQVRKIYLRFAEPAQAQDQ